MRSKRILFIATATILAICGAALWTIPTKFQAPEEPNPSMGSTRKTSRAQPKDASGMTQHDKTEAPPENSILPPAVTLETPQSESPITEIMPSKWKVEFFQKGKDEWAYETQQRIEQFLASHRHATHFEVKSVECRTIGCVVRARAFDVSAVPEWQAIALELSQQQWNEIGSFGTDAMDGSSSIEISMTIQRKTN
jgi:hypothetical protein